MREHAQPAADVRTEGPARDAILLVSCYELGQEPLGLTVPAGVLARAGFPSRLLDLSVAPIDEDAIARADLVAISAPMHTALRLGTEVASIVRRINSRAHICFFGLYAGLNTAHLLPRLADSCLGAEFEAPLLDLARRIAHGRRDGSAHPREIVPSPALSSGARSAGRSLDLTPLRDGLGHRDRYVKLDHGGEHRMVGYVAATRGCKHLCRHCPLPPAYAGVFYALPLERVLDDLATVVQRGARHVTFADPDFLNGPTHALRVARETARRFPGLSFDYTAKIEHLLRHRDAVTELHELGSLFVVSAVESFNNRVLLALHKGHSRDDAFAVVRRLRAQGLALRPTFVPFTPWETRESYAELFDIVAGEGLSDHVDLVQYSIRLLVPEGSLLLDAEAMRPHVGAFDAETFTYSWAHPDPSMDALQRTVARLAARAAEVETTHAEVFARIRDAVTPDGAPHATAHRAGRVPRLTENWFC